MKIREALSRRALLSGAAASVAVAGQQPQPEQRASELEVARRQQQDGYEQLRKTKLPMTVEPATVFKP